MLRFIGNANCSSTRHSVVFGVYRLSSLWGKQNIAKVPAKALLANKGECIKQKPESVMMTSSNGNIFRVTGPLCGEFTGSGEFPTQRPVTQSFDVIFDLRLNKRLGKQPWGWRFETPSWSLWLQCNGQGQMTWHKKNKAHCNHIHTVIILGMGSANERRRYIVTSSLIDQAHPQYDPCHISWIDNGSTYLSWIEVIMTCIIVHM